MCLTLLSSQASAFEVQLFGEYHFPRFAVDGDITEEEVYDVFLRAKEDLCELDLVCVSPHDLLRPDGSLSISVHDILGGDTAADIVYKAPVGCGHNYESSTAMSTVTLRDTTDDFSPTSLTLSGQLLRPEIRDLADPSHRGTELLAREVGTIFRVRLRDLKAAASYAIRLSLHPQHLNGMPPRLPLAPRWSSRPIGWKQRLRIVAPRLNLFNTQSLLEECRSLSTLRSASLHMLTTINDVDFEIIESDLHRIVVLLPESVEHTTDDALGYASKVATHVLSDSRQAVEWMSGNRHYWRDSPQQVARRVREYLDTWACGTPKAVEFITTALNVDHQNIRVILDALCQVGAARLIDSTRGLYASIESPANDRDAVLSQLGKLPGVREGFRWTGFAIEYWVSYPATSRLDISVLLALVLSVVALLVSIVSLCV